MAIQSPRRDEYEKATGYRVGHMNVPEVFLNKLLQEFFRVGGGAGIVLRQTRVPRADRLPSGLRLLGFGRRIRSPNSGAGLA